MHTNVRQQLYKRYAMVLHHPFILKVACLAKLPRVVTIHRLIDSNIFAITNENEIYKASISELVNSIEKLKN